VTHFLFAALLAAIFRDYIIKRKGKKKFPLHYVLIAGIGGVLPNIDILFYLFFHSFYTSLDSVHRTITHSLAFVMLLFLLSVPAYFIRNKTKHHIKTSVSFIILGLGVMTHIALDMFFGTNIMLFYPFSSISVGFDLLDFLPSYLSSIAVPLFDGILLMVWIIYLEVKHKINDFI